MRIKLKFLSDAVAPTKAHPTDAAYDLYTKAEFTITPDIKRAVLPLGFAMELPEGYCAEIHPRSGFASKGLEAYDVHGHTIRVNADVVYGLIDACYRNEVGVILHNSEQQTYTIPKGTRIAQMVIRRVEDTEIELTDELTPTDRIGGFGSTGSK